MRSKVHDPCNFASAKLHAARVARGRQRAYPYEMPLSEQDYAKKIGERLRLARKAAPGRLTQGDAAVRLAASLGETDEGASPASRVSNYENGHRLPDLRTIVALCEIYGCSPAMIIDDASATRTQQEQQLLRMFRETDDRGRNQITRVAESQPDYAAADPVTRAG